MKATGTPRRLIHAVVLAGLALICGLVYGNTFDASWHLDDQPNIVNNTYLHLDALELQKLVNTFYTDHHNPEQLNDRLYRPVACLSFALNWYIGQDNVFGYHIVNLAIHVLTAFWLYLFVLALFETPRLKGSAAGSPVWIAILASILWAIHPIQTQAVTYIVQRMAQLAAFFYLLGMIAYIRFKLSPARGKSILWLASCAGFFFLGLQSKPNAAMLPMAIVLLEVIFFQDLADKRTRRAVFLSVAVIAISVLAMGSLLFLKGNPFSFLDLYGSRTFSLSERLLTQPRILCFYLSQIILPLPDRFSIAHDVVLSTSLVNPWTTLPSLLGVLALIGLGLSQIGKRPILAFAILFFFLNHMIESSFIGLELIFEHRNYLPSFFLFLPVAWGLDHLLSRVHRRNRNVHAAIVVGVVAVLLGLSISSHIRNRVWKDDVTLWMDAVSKAPNNARASNILAIKLAWGEHSRHPRRYDMALKLFEESLKKSLPRNDVKAGIYGNMALVTFYHKRDPQKAFQYFDEALKINPDNLKIRREYAEALTVNRDFSLALAHADLLVARRNDNGRYLNLKGHILLWLERYEEALPYFKKAFPLLADKSSVILNSAVALSRSGRYDDAEKFLLEATEIFPADMTFYFAGIENSLRKREEDRARFYAQKMLTVFSEKEIMGGLESFTDNPKYAPLDAGHIGPLLDHMRRAKSE